VYVIALLGEILPCFEMWCDVREDEVDALFVICIITICELSIRVVRMRNAKSGIEILLYERVGPPAPAQKST